MLRQLQVEMTRAVAFKKDSVAVLQKAETIASLIGKDANRKLADNEQLRTLLKMLVKRVTDAVTRSPFEPEWTLYTATAMKGKFADDHLDDKVCVRSIRTVIQLLKTRDPQEAERQASR